jgi:hypothetical protein
MLLEQLRRDPDVIGQLEAVNGLREFPLSQRARAALEAVIRGHHIFWPVRVAAVHAVALNHLLADQKHAGAATLMKLYHTYFSDLTDTSGGLRPNQFTDLALYHLQKEIPLAIAQTRREDGYSPQDAIEYLIFLLDRQDNTSNPYSDAYVAAALAEAMGHIASSRLTIDVPRIQQYLRRMLALDFVLPSHNNVIAAACLRGLAGLLGHDAMSMLWAHAQAAMPFAVRRAALDSIVRIAAVDELPQLVTILESDPSPRIRKHLAKELRLRIPQSAYEPLRQADDSSAAALAERIWAAINSQATAYESKVRMCLIDLYAHIWGTGTPQPLWKEDVPALSIPEADVAAAAAVITTAAAAGPRSSSVQPRLFLPAGHKRKTPDDEDSAQAFFSPRSHTPITIRASTPSAPVVRVKVPQQAQVSAVVSQPVSSSPHSPPTTVRSQPSPAPPATKKVVIKLAKTPVTNAIKPEPSETK